MVIALFLIMSKRKPTMLDDVLTISHPEIGCAYPEPWLPLAAQYSGHAHKSAGMSSSATYRPCHGLVPHFPRL